MKITTEKSTQFCSDNSSDDQIISFPPQAFKVKIYYHGIPVILLGNLLWVKWIIKTVLKRESYYKNSWLF